MKDLKLTIPTMYEEEDDYLRILRSSLNAIRCIAYDNFNSKMDHLTQEEIDHIDVQINIINSVLPFSTNFQMMEELKTKKEGIQKLSNHIEEFVLKSDLLSDEEINKLKEEGLINETKTQITTP